MGTRQIEPDATVTDQWARTGGTTTHVVLADDLDSSYMVPAGGVSRVLQVGFADPAPVIPALARILDLVLTVRRQFLGVDSHSLSLRLTTPTKGDCPAQNLSTFSGVLANADLIFPRAGDGSEWTIADVIEVQSKAVASTNANFRLIDEEILVTYNEVPTATLTGPADEDPVAAGITVKSGSPTYSWTYSDPEGEPQEGFQLVIVEQPVGGWTGFDVDAYLASFPIGTPAPGDTGFVFGETTAVGVGYVLMNNTNYRAYLRVADPTPTGYTRRLTPWTFYEFATSFTPAPQPNVVVTPIPDQARVTLDVTHGPRPTPASTPLAEHYVIERSSDGGTTWTEISDSPLVNPVTLNGGLGTVQATDRYAPRDTALLYRVFAVDVGSTGSTYSPAVIMGSELVSDGQSWIKATSVELDLGLSMIPTGSNPSTVSSDSEEPQGVFWAAGRRYPIIHSGTIRSEVFESVTFFLGSDAELAVFEQIRGLQETVLLQMCQGDSGMEQRFVRFGTRRGNARLVTPDQNDEQHHLVTIPVFEVAGVG